MNLAKVIKAFRQKQRLYQTDPVLFAKEVVGYVPDDWQLIRCATSPIPSAGA